MISWHRRYTASPFTGRESKTRIFQVNVVQNYRRNTIVSVCFLPRASTKSSYSYTMLAYVCVDLTEYDRIINLTTKLYNTLHKESVRKIN